ncbi:MAG: rRNA pseudouridine synthase [Eubacteriaceae bacterium]|nr:rRNA pseudouridine synthase [Eubacteriaceae bacterium]
MRINRYLAKSNVAARRKCDELVTSGRVKVNGEVVVQLGFDVSQGDIVEVDSKVVSPDLNYVYYMLNKPRGVISASSSTHGDTTVVDLIKGGSGQRIYPVGRLDKDSEGLIFLTNDGDFAYQLTHPKFEKVKEYDVVVSGPVDHAMATRLRKGVSDKTNEKLQAKVRIVKTAPDKSLLHITLREGKNRQIRRMVEIVGRTVISLKRVSEGGLRLESLGVGEYRQLSNAEVDSLLRSQVVSTKQAAQRGKRGASATRKPEWPNNAEGSAKKHPNPNTRSWEGRASSRLRQPSESPNPERRGQARGPAANSRSKRS